MDAHRKTSSSAVADQGKSIITLNISPLATVSSLNHFPLALAIGSFGGCMALLAAAVHCCWLRATCSAALKISKIKKKR